MLSWIFRLIKGMIIALGFILPGVSGGVLAAILGIYERLLSFLAHIGQDFKINFFFFLPVGLGGILGLILFSAPLEFLLSNFQVTVLWGFAGAIFGSLPALFKEGKLFSNNPRLKSPTEYTWLIATFFISLFLLYFFPAVGLKAPANFWGFIFAGILIALGALVPGLSPSNLLLILGLFSPMLKGFQNRDIFGVFLPISIGLVLTLLAFSRLMETVLNNYHKQVYQLIIGLVLSSTFLILIPTKSSESISYDAVQIFTIMLTAFFFVVGLGLGFWMTLLEKKYK